MKNVSPWVYAAAITLLAIPAYIIFQQHQSEKEAQRIKTTTLDNALAYYRSPKSNVTIYEARLHLDNVKEQYGNDSKEFQSLLTGFDKLRDSPTHAKEEEDRLDAIYQAERDRENNNLSSAEESYLKHDFAKKYVKQRLKSPSTAKFGKMEASIKSGFITITGVVDSQNGFGAMLRTHFVIKTDRKLNIYSFETVP